MNLAAQNRRMNLKSLGARIRSRREEIQMTQEELASCVGVTYQAVYAWEKGSIPRPKKLDKIAACLKTTVDELFHGKKAHVNGGTHVMSTPQNVQIVELKGRVPLISWTLAGNWKNARKTFHPGDAEKYVHVTVGVGDMAFALRIEGDSMEPRVPAGSMVVIDPDRPSEHGSIVLARKKNGKVVLKQLVNAGQERFLRPLNPAYPASNADEAELLGVAVQVVLDL